MIAADKKQETLTLVVQAVGVSTAKIAALNSGEEIKDIVGPLGKPTLVQQYGTVVCVGSGIGIASLLCSEKRKQSCHRCINGARE